MPGPAFLLAPGAGAPSSHPRMQTFARLLATIGPVEPFDYSYALAGRGRPDPLPKLIEAHRAALAALRAGNARPALPARPSRGRSEADACALDAHRRGGRRPLPYSREDGAEGAGIEPGGGGRQHADRDRTLSKSSA